MCIVSLVPLATLSFSMIHAVNCACIIEKLGVARGRVVFSVAMC